MNLQLTSTLNTVEATGRSGDLLEADIAASVSDLRQYPTGRTATLIVDWGNGDVPYSSGRLAVPFSIAARYVYRIPGSYTVTVTAKNYELPTPESVSKEFTVSLGQPLQLGAGLTVPNPVIYGPILPRDHGFPNANEWEFQVAHDNVELESLAKMLLITATGERLMSDFGTNIRRLLFNPTGATTNSQITQELNRAFSQYIPQVTVLDVNVLQIDERTVALTVNLVSNLDKAKLSVTVAVPL